MSMPDGFSWVEKPLLAALARPTEADHFTWLRSQGIQVLVSLTEDRPRRDWTDAAGLLVFHEPLEDMEAPSQEQLERCVSAISKALNHNLPVAVHCGAGLGRTGVVLAAWFVVNGASATSAITKVRKLRPGSIETKEQEEAIQLFARQRRKEGEKPEGE
jgi:atypical dual specificity phosphatase